MAYGKRKFQWNQSDDWEELFAEPTGNGDRLTTYVDESFRRIRLGADETAGPKFVSMTERIQ